MNKVFVIEFRGRSSKHWHAKSSYFVYNDALRDKRLLAAEAVDLPGKTEYRVTKFVPERMNNV